MRLDIKHGKLSLINALLFSKPSKQVSIVIPIYKSKLTEDEQFSIEQCLKHLTDYDIFLLIPDSIDWNSTITNLNITLLPCDDSLLTSIQSYDEMLRSAFFYLNFTNYEYILIYQLDAIVFRDELSYWCNKNYDYIGAPLYEADQNAVDYVLNNYQSQYLQPYKKQLKNKLLINGGLSLRKVRSFLKVLLFNQKKALLWGRHEDLFWSLVPQLYTNNFKLPSHDECKDFALMINVKQEYQNNSSKLPFGGHGWFSYCVDEWQDIFKENNIH